MNLDSSMDQFLRNSITHPFDMEMYEKIDERNSINVKTRQKAPTSQTSTVP